MRGILTRKRFRSYAQKVRMSIAEICFPEGATEPLAVAALAGKSCYLHSWSWTCSLHAISYLEPRVPGKSAAIQQLVRCQIDLNTQVNEIPRPRTWTA